MNCNTSQATSNPLWYHARPKKTYITYKSLIPKPNNHWWWLFCCAKIAMSDCVSAKELPRKDITIGYYHQPSVLLFKNDIPQMAVMKTNNPQDSINGNYSYSSTQTTISVFNLISLGAAIFFSIVCLFDVVFKRKSKKQPCSRLDISH